MSHNQHLADFDPDIAALLDAELHRQQSTLEMIASENFAPVASLEAQGSVLTNKYAEGYPGKRYYGGCEFVDQVETIAIERLKQLFDAGYANVQPHSGATANAAALHAIATVGDTILGLDLANGGHLTHGMKLNFSGKLYNPVAYHVVPETGLVDMDEVRGAGARAPAHGDHRRLVGLPAPARLRAVPRDRRRGRRQAVGRHGALRRASSPPACTPARCRTRTSSRPRRTRRSAARVVARSSPMTRTIAKKMRSAVFPGQQGGPLEHVIAAKAVAFKMALEPEFTERQQRTIEGAQILAARLMAEDSRAAGINVLTGGTDVHLVLVDLRDSELDGQQAEDRLHEAGITVNRNAVPNDPRPPMVTSGLRIGTPALATRGSVPRSSPRSPTSSRRPCCPARSTWKGCASV